VALRGGNGKGCASIVVVGVHLPAEDMEALH
jgi:hypothetical protein